MKSVFVLAGVKVTHVNAIAFKALTSRENPLCDKWQYLQLYDTLDVHEGACGFVAS